VLSIFLCHSLLSKQNYRKEIVLWGDVLMALSWELIIYSAQMEPYIISVPFGFLILIVLTYWEKKSISDKRLCLITVIVTVISCYSQFQLFLVVFTFYLAIFLSSLIQKNWKEIKLIIISGVATVISCVPLLCHMLKSNMLGRSINWNIGVHGEFLFDTTSCNNAVDYFIYTVSFFAKNTFLIIKYFFTTDIAYVSNILAFVLLCFLVIGGIRTAHSAFVHKSRSSISIFLFCLIYLFLIVIGKQVLGPSRHSIVLIPYLVILILSGLQLTIQYIKSAKAVKTLLLTLFLLELVPFSISAREEMHERSNKISQSIMDNVVETYHPAAIVGLEFRMFDFYIFDFYFNEYNNQPKWCEYSLLLKNGISCFEPGDKIVFMSCNQIKDSEIGKSVELVDNEIFTDFLAKYNLNLVSSEENTSNRTIDYAIGYWTVDLWPDGLCIYVYEISEKPGISDESEVSENPAISNEQ
jgi:hypothetical protein